MNIYDLKDGQFVSNLRDLDGQLGTSNKLEDVKAVSES